MCVRNPCCLNISQLGNSSGEEIKTYSCFSILRVLIAFVKATHL